MQYNGSKVFDFQERGDVFSNSFNSVIKRDDYVTLYEDCFFSDFDISGHFLGNITLSLSCYRIFLEQLDIRKSCGPDDITSGLLKECASSISTLFGTMFTKQPDGGFSKHMDGGKLGSSPQV